MSEKRKKTVVTLRIDREILERAREILKERELTIPAFLRLKLKELIKEEEKCQSQNT